MRSKLRLAAAGLLPATNTCTGQAVRAFARLSMTTRRAGWSQPRRLAGVFPIFYFP